MPKSAASWKLGKLLGGAKRRTKGADLRKAQTRLHRLQKQRPQAVRAVGKSRGAHNKVWDRCIEALYQPRDINVLTRPCLGRAYAHHPSRAPLISILPGAQVSARGSERLFRVGSCPRTWATHRNIEIGGRGGQGPFAGARAFISLGAE